MNQPKPTLSWSALAQYMRCPRQYFFSRVARVPAALKSSALFEGSCGHAAVERYFSLRLAGKTPNNKEILDFFDSYWDAAFMFEEYRWDDGPPAARQKAVRMALKAYLEMVAPELEPRFIEYPWRVALPQCSFDLGGIVDLVDTSLRIVDHKFYRRLPSQENVDADGQLSIYAIARADGAFGCADNWTDIPIGLAAAVKGTSVAKPIWTRRNAAQLIWWRRAIVDIAKAIDANAWPPNVNGWWHSPKWCDFWDICMEGV